MRKALLLALGTAIVGSANAQPRSESPTPATLESIMEAQDAPASVDALPASQGSPDQYGAWVLDRKGDKTSPDQFIVFTDDAIGNRLTEWCSAAYKGCTWAVIVAGVRCVKDDDYNMVANGPLGAILITVKCGGSGNKTKIDASILLVKGVNIKNLITPSAAGNLGFAYPLNDAASRFSPLA